MARISRVSLTDFTAPGSLFDGKFLVERELGRGGMGSVLLVRHPELGTRVALKVMLPEHATDERLVERFLREGRATARLSSEHVARVFDAGRHADGFPYLVMEFLAGYTLHDRLARGGPLGVPAAVDLLLQACEGVAHAHAAGIVHRDLKPANLFLVPRPDGSVCLKVLDFGIAKDVGGANPMTATAESFGSPEYMSPEQIRAAKTVDPRSDVWALGVVLFEMLTGRVPFESASVFEVASKILGEAPLPVGALRPDAPPGLQAALATCLEKSPQRRFQGVGQLAAAIAPFGGPGAAAAAERAAKTVGLGSGPAFTQVSQGAAERIAVSGIAPTEPHGASSRRPTTGLRARQRLAAVAAGMLAASVLVAGFGAWALHTSRLPRAAPEPGAS
ncbi:MAG TPA: serine/threonine-protein kinase, partial [Polyangiaceae bacterium]|nr:serine/threonine-protein kinase [Polyangiaceae bacterium]